MSQKTNRLKAKQVNPPLSGWWCRHAALTIHGGGVIAYPTEAVFGLGCDPNNATAVRRLLALKQRPVEKGLILIAADFTQLLPYIGKLSAQQRKQVLASWPGAVTWLLPVNEHTPVWLHGQHDTLAVRVTAHPLVRQLCNAIDGPLVSTSANMAGQHPTRTSLGVRQRFGDMLDLIVPGHVGSRHAAPSKIIDLRSGKTLRSA